MPQPPDSGDIRLERISDLRTRVTYRNLGGPEKDALTQLRRASVSPRCRWATEEDWNDDIQQGLGEFGPAPERSIILRGPIDAVGRFVRRQLRPDRASLSAVRIGQGKIQEIHESQYQEEELDDEVPGSSWKPPIE